MSPNPLKPFFRQATCYVKLPTRSLWYDDNSVETTEDGEVAIFPMSALDDILLNTPDAMLNGQALEKVITNCVPGVKNIKRLMLPDLEAIFVGIKSATNNGKTDYERKCPKCGHDNLYDLSCQALLDQTTFIHDDDTILKFADDLIIYLRPYDFEMRQLFIRREFEEERTLRALDLQNEKEDEMTRAKIIGESVDRLSQITFTLVSRSIAKIQMVATGEIVTNAAHINEWLVGISKTQADLVMEAVNKLNAAGVPKEIAVACTSCGHQWTDSMSFDPSSFFVKRSPQPTQP